MSDHITGSRKRMTGRYLYLLLLLLAACNTDQQPGAVLFKARTSDATGLRFENRLQYDGSFNLFRYMYFYNGSGVGAADFNNDGLTDLFFGANQQQDRLFLNTGNLKFRDITQQAGIPADNGWTTGISVVDINNDGRMDIYVCRVGNYEVLRGRNLLLVNTGNDAQGIPRFREQAKEYGLDFSGFSTQAAFLDYDLDGDLDMFLLNHSVHENGTFKPRNEFLGTYHPLSGDRFYRNEGGRYTDVTRSAGINSSAIGYGLGVVVSDINLDGWPDLYIGNDFHENDYLYINQRNGTFRDEGAMRMMHSSQFSMGVDVADINNDAHPEIISADMLPDDPYILKRSLGEDTYDIFNYKIGVGYAHQYTRNNLQYNRRNGLFSEVGLQPGVAATDWSWAPLWADFDNDGRKDLFISNGIPKRMNDIDYINFVTQGDVQQMIRDKNLQAKDIALISKFPEIKLPNRFFRNNGGLDFSDMAAAVEGNEPTYSNGAVYADMDNDGDLDIVVNNIDAQVLLYENQTASPARRGAVALQLTGTDQNRQATGARLLLFAGTETLSYEHYPVRGFLSSMETPMLIASGGRVVDSAILIWPDNRYERLSWNDSLPRLSLEYRKGLPLFDYSLLSRRYPAESFPAADITAQSGFVYQHVENRFAAFDREPLIPHMLSTEGPALAVADINGDGLEDVFIGASRDQQPALFVQGPGGRLQRSVQPDLSADSSFETTGACFADVNKDGFPDLLLASGGNEFFGEDEHNTPRLYLNNGKGQLQKVPGAFGTISLTASCIITLDANGDGYPDCFIGGRVVPWEYGQVPRSCLMLNDGQNHFTDASSKLAPGLESAGFVTGAATADINRDGKPDILLSLEWGGIDAWVSGNGTYSRRSLTDRTGWWSFVYPADVDGDGDTDILAGNLGLNSRLKATAQHPVRLYYNDFDGNGKKEQILTYYLGNRELPFANKAELEKQLPQLKKKFLYAGDFAKASLEDLFTKEKLNQSQVFTAAYFDNAVLINDGKGQFTLQALPQEAQMSTFRTAVPVRANGDQWPDYLLMGNFYSPNIEMGRYDADLGTVLMGKGKGTFSAECLQGTPVKGQVRHALPIRLNGTPAIVLAMNNDSARILRFH